MSAIQAIILCAGVGRRLRPYTDTLPKPLVRVKDVEIIRHQAQALKAVGVQKIVMVTGYLADALEEASQKIDGRSWGEVAQEHGRLFDALTSEK